MTPRSLRLTPAGGATESTGPGRLVCPQQHRTRALFFPHGGLGVQPRPPAVTSLGLPRRVPLNTNKQHLFSTISPPPFWTSLSFTSPALPTAPQPSSSPTPGPALATFHSTRNYFTSTANSSSNIQLPYPLRISLGSVDPFTICYILGKLSAMVTSKFRRCVGHPFCASALPAPPLISAPPRRRAQLFGSYHVCGPHGAAQPCGPALLLAHYHCHRAACASSAAVMVSRQLFVCGRPSFHFPTRCFPLVRHYPHLLHLFASHLRGLLHHGFRYQKRPLRNSRSQT